MGVGVGGAGGRVGGGGVGGRGPSGGAGVVPQHVSFEVALLEAPHGAHWALERLLARVRQQVVVQVLAGVDPVGHEAAEGARQLGPRGTLGTEQLALRVH